MNQSIQKVKKQQPYVGFSLRERILPVILLALAACLTVMIFTPLDIFANNMKEFSFVLSDFFGWNILWAVIGIGIVIAVLLPMRKRLFDIFFSIALWGTLMLFIQGSYLSMGLSSVSGDGVGSDIPSWQILLNLGIWVVFLLGILALFFLTRPSFRENLRLIVIVALITVLGMQTVNAAVTLLTRDLFTPRNVMQEELNDPDIEPQQRYLSYRNFNHAGEDGNVFYFVVDRFDNEYFEIALERMPEIAEQLDGFTYYDDAISLYPRTYPSVTYMVTGEENDFTQSRVDYLNQAYKNSDFLHRLHDNGYSVNIFTDNYTAYENASYMADYIANASESTEYIVHDTVHLSVDFFRLSLYRHLPFALNHIAGTLSTTHFSNHVSFVLENEPKYSTDMKDAYEYLSEHPLQIDENKKNFSFIHIAGTHLPNAYDKNFEPIADKSHPEYADITSSLTQSFKIIGLYIEQLKDMGLYEDATIVITGDHASIGSDSAVPLLYAHLTTLLVKESGQADTPLTRSHAPVSHENIFASILLSEEISADGFAPALSEISVSDTYERRYLFQAYAKNPEGKVDYEYVEYRVTGEAADFDHWEIISRRYLGKSIHD